MFPLQWIVSRKSPTTGTKMGSQHTPSAHWAAADQETSDQCRSHDHEMKDSHGAGGGVHHMEPHGANNLQMAALHTQEADGGEVRKRVAGRRGRSMQIGSCVCFSPIMHVWGP